MALGVYFGPEKNDYKLEIGEESKMPEKKTQSKGNSGPGIIVSIDHAENIYIHEENRSSKGLNIRK